MLEKASNAKKILMLFMSENAKNYAGLFYRWLASVCMYCTSFPAWPKAKAKAKLIDYCNTGRHTCIYLPEVKVCDPKTKNNRKLGVASWLIVLQICKLQKHHCT